VTINDTGEAQIGAPRQSPGVQDRRFGKLGRAGMVSATNALKVLHQTTQALDVGLKLGYGDATGDEIRHDVFHCFRTHEVRSVKVDGGREGSAAEAGDYGVGANAGVVEFDLNELLQRQ